MSEAEYDKEQLRIMRNAFKAFDHDEKGVIEYKDVQQILEILGQKLDDKAVKALLKEVDKANSGKLDFGQFCKLASRFVEVEEDAPALVSELKEAFRVYDKEGKGYLTVQTLRGILRELDDKLSASDLDMIIDEIDADGSGTVDFDEFLQVMTGENFYDLTFNRHFVFASDAVPHHCWTPACKARDCPTRRLRLHRRIEWHFERLFEQMWRPLDVWHKSFTSLTCPDVKSAAIPTSSHSKPANAGVKHTTCKHTKTTTTTSTKNNTKFTKTTDIKETQTFAPRSVHCSGCYHTAFRPRFPKWVPIFTLYRELLQNPFRRRTRIMITHN